MATILIVDDRPMDRQFLITLLRYAGHRLLQAGDGEQALHLVAKERPDLVIADVLMPEMDGYEFVRQLRSESGTARTRVIFYTAAYRDQVARNLAGACGVQLLEKPSEPEAILKAVGDALAAGGAAASSVPPDFDQVHRRLVNDKLAEHATKLEVVTGRLARLIALGLELGSEPDPRRLVEHCCREGRDLLLAERAVIALLDDDGQTLQVTMAGGSGQQGVEQRHPTSAWKDGLGVIEAAPRVLRCQGPAARGLRLPYPAAQSFLGAAVASPTRGYGWLYFVDKLGAAEFSDEDEGLAALLASHLAIACENARRYQIIQQHARELEQRVAETQAALQLRNEFISIAAHELRTPLTSLLGFTQLALRLVAKEPASAPERLPRLLQTMERQSMKLRRLLYHLLDVSRLERGRLELELELTNVARLVKEAASTVQAGTDRNTLIVNADQDVWALVDRIRFEQVVVNLLDNAVKFSPDGRSIDVDVSRPVADTARIAVRDHGIGIPPENRHRIFERFSQAHADSHRRGMGLGLFISRSIVELHGGQIVAEFPPDGGTRFVVTLPAATDMPDAASGFTPARRREDGPA